MRTPPSRRATRRATLVADGLTVTLDFLGEDTLDVEQADATVARVPRRARGAQRAGPAPATPRSRSSCRAVGQALPGRRREDRPRERPHHLPGRAQRRHHGDPRHGGPHHHRLDAGRSCASCARTSPRPARCCRPTCTAPRTTAATWPTRAPGCGCARAPTTSPSTVAFQDKADVDKSYVRCLKVLLAGQGYPMVATHDPRMIEIARPIAGDAAAGPRAPTSSRCSTASAPRSRSAWSRDGETMRVYVPYGDEWYGYLMRRLAERPAEPVVLPEVPDLQEVGSPP